MKKLKLLSTFLTLFLCLSCSTEVLWGDNEEIINETRAIDTGTTPIKPDPVKPFPPDSVPVIPGDNPNLSEYEKGQSLAHKEVTDNFTRYAKDNKHRFATIVPNQPPMEGFPGDPGFKTEYDIDSMYLAFCNNDPWAVNRRTFVAQFDQNNASEYMKG